MICVPKNDQQFKAVGSERPEMEKQLLQVFASCTKTDVALHNLVLRARTNIHVVKICPKCFKTYYQIFRWIPSQQGCSQDSSWGAGPWRARSNPLPRVQHLRKVQGFQNPRLSQRASPEHPSEMPFPIWNLIHHWNQWYVNPWGYMRAYLHVESG